MKREGRADLFKPNLSWGRVEVLRMLGVRFRFCPALGFNSLKARRTLSQPVWAYMIHYFYYSEYTPGDTYARKNSVLDFRV